MLLQVPVVAIFTKFDSLDADAYEELCQRGVPSQEALDQARDLANKTFDNTLSLIGTQRHPPGAEIRLRSERLFHLCMHTAFVLHVISIVSILDMHRRGRDSNELIQKAMSELIEKTANLLNNKTLQVFLQQLNIQLSMRYAVNQ